MKTASAETHSDQLFRAPTCTSVLLKPYRFIWCVRSNYCHPNFDAFWHQPCRFISTDYRHFHLDQAYEAQTCMIVLLKPYRSIQCTCNEWEAPVWSFILSPKNWCFWTSTLWTYVSMVTQRRDMKLWKHTLVHVYMFNSPVLGACYAYYGCINWQEATWHSNNSNCSARTPTKEIY